MGCNCKEPPAARPPSVLTMAGNATRAAGRVIRAAIKGEQIYVSDKQFEERIAICADCEFVIRHETKPKYLRCSKCGCPTSAQRWLNGKHAAKAGLATERCPENKWPELSTINSPPSTKA